MIEFADINYWAVAITWLLTVVLGAYWYSPAGFGKQWAKLTGVNHMKMEEKDASRAIGYIAFAAFLQTLVLAIIINSLHITTLANALIAGFIIWLGFTAATSVGNALYLRFGWKFWWLNGSYYLIVIALGAVILTLWR